MASQPSLNIESLSHTTSAHPTPSFSPTVANAPSPAGQHDAVYQGLFVVLSVLFSMATMIPATLLKTFTLVTITVPSWIFHVMSMSLTFTMNFTTLLIIALAIVSTVSWFIRYRFLNVYTRLPQESTRKEPSIDLFPESQDDKSKPGMNYLDEFLSAIKIFGFLERSVFLELTRQMQTRRIIAGETIMLEDEKGFAMVVDGVVQIFVKSLRDSHDKSADEDDESYHEGNQGYQLLTEVKNGASMSSLFSILSLFTEDINLRHDDSRSYTPESTLNTNPSTPSHFQHERNPFHEAHGLAASARLPRVPPLTLDAPFEGQLPRKATRRTESTTSAHPDIVARALVDTTIAIIPASAFKRLTRVYPKATAHIVQVILTRLQRVTFSTAHQYLGLTSELLQIEKLMNKYTNFDLNVNLRGTALDRLKDKFKKEKERLGDEDITKGIALHNPITNRRRSSSSLRKEAALAARVAASKAPIASNGSAVHAADDREKISAGDLVSNAHHAKSSTRSGSMNFGHARLRSLADVDGIDRAGSPLQTRDRSHFRPIYEGSVQRQDTANEDAMFRESVLDSIIKVLGSESAKEAPRRIASSVEQSPRMVSFDAKKQTAVFNNAFGFIDAYEGSADGDTESITASLASLSQGRTLNESLLDDVEIVYFPAGSILVEQGERNPGLYYVIDGFLDVSIPVDEKDERGAHPVSTARKPSRNAPPSLRRTQTSSTRKPSMPAGQVPKKQVQKSLFLIKPGGISGYIGTLSSSRSFTDITAKTDVYVGFLPRSAIERVVERFPLLLLTMAKRLTSLIPRIILHVDFALDWVSVGGGEVVYRQGDDSDSIYIVLNGRLRSVRESDDGTMNAIDEFGQGESIGELEVMTEDRRGSSLHAMRQTELCRLPRTLFNSLAQEHPSITLQISKLLAQKMRALAQNASNQEISRGAVVAKSSNLNLRTVAILPVTAGVPVTDFGNRLLAALSQTGVPGGVTLLNQSIVLNHLGRHAFSRLGSLKLTNYLADLEQRFGLILYVADTSVSSPWTQTCMTSADRILLVGLAESSHRIGEYERLLLKVPTAARKELVLLHLERYSKPGLTRKWLRNRSWINGDHHHIQMAFRTTPEATPQAMPRRFGNAIKQRVQILQAEIQKYTSRRVRPAPLYSTETPFKGDMHRLARRLCGRSVGLVLGGGGARGVSQIGVIRSLEEAGIPIDIVGGTSIGAFIGALYSRDADLVPLLGRARSFSGRMACE